MGSLWDPFRVLAERAARSSSFDVRVPVYNWPDQATLYSLLALYKALAQADGSVPPATRAALALVAAPLLVPHGVSLRKYGLSPRAVVEDRELWRCAVSFFEKSRLQSCLGSVMLLNVLREVASALFWPLTRPQGLARVLSPPHWAATCLRRVSHGLIHTRGDHLTLPPSCWQAGCTHHPSH